MSQHFEIEPLPSVTFGAVVTGVRLANLCEEDFTLLYEAWLEHALLIFPEQHLERDEQVAFARRFGKLELRA